MKNLISVLSNLVFASLLTLSTLASMPFASAQDLAKADIPFAFHVGNKVMPSGTYTISHNSGVSYILRSGSSAAFVLFYPESSNKDRGTVITFNRYGNSYYLSQVWDGHDGLQCSKSHSEKVTIRETEEAANKQASSGSVALALNKTPQR